MNKLIAGLLFSMLFASCHDVKKQKQLDMTARMIATVDSIQQVWENTDVAATPAILTEVSSVTDTILKNYNTDDTITIETAKKLEAYKMILKGLKNAEKVSSQIEAGTKQEKSALISLQQDISSGNGDRSKYNGYIRFEKNKVRQLNVLLTKWIETRTNCLDSYQKLHNEIKEFSESLRSLDSSKNTR